MLNNALVRARSVAEYQFGRGAGKSLFPANVELVFSLQTGRIRHILLQGDMLATLRPTDGLFSLTIEGGRRLSLLEPRRLWVEIQVEVAPYVGRGRSVFARHVVDCDSQIRPGEEVIVVDASSNVFAVGRAALSGEEMKAFSRGVAVRVRRGIAEKKGSFRRVPKK